MTSTDNNLSALGARAAKAQKSLARAGSAVKDRALLKAAELLRSGVPAITAANALDIAAAREAGVREAMIDRLALDAGR
nr:gamma-glutamyl-phosphate reductase [Clostridiales bacterium]